MINQPPPFKGLNIRIPILIPVKGKRFIDQGSGLIFGGGVSNILRLILFAYSTPDQEDCKWTVMSDSA